MAVAADTDSRSKGDANEDLPTSTSFAVGWKDGLHLPRPCSKTLVASQDTGTAMTWDGIMYLHACYAHL